MTRTKPRASKVVVGYCRVSTAHQVDEGVSLEAQQARIVAWAQANGYQLLGVHVDAGLSGGKAANRPALQAALEEVCRERGALVVYSLSPLPRAVMAPRPRRPRGERIGEFPFGYRVAADGTPLEADETEQAILSRLRTLRGRG